MGKTINAGPRARLYAARLRTATHERFRNVHATWPNSLTIRRRHGYKSTSSSTEDQSTDDEDPDN